MMKLRKIYEIKGKIILLSGLHIGMGNQEIHIGGIDNPVIKHPLTNEPYIPGSSLKGKMRALLEYKLGKVRDDGRPWFVNDEDKVKDDPICRIFGSGDPKYPSGPTRLIVRDCYLTGKYKERIDNPNDDLTVFDLFEGKWETAIDRKNGTAKRGSLRQTERVIAGTEFAFNMTYKVLDDKDEANFHLIEKGIELLQNDALGGSGSRGYGRIKIEYEVIEHDYSKMEAENSQ